MRKRLELERLLSVEGGWVRDFYVGDDDAIRKFACDNDEHNRLHHDSIVARGNGLLGICAPGLMVLKFINTSISDKIPHVMVCELYVRMKAPVYAQTLLSVRCNVLRQGSRISEIGIRVQNGFEVVAEGSCTLLLPKTKRA